MGKYSCEKCAKSFSQKSHYEKHLIRKNPCEIQTDKIKALIDKAVEEKIIELNKKMILNNAENNITINITEQMDTSTMSKLELLEKCKELGITKCSSKNKSQLIELINSKQKISDCELKTEVVEPNNICQFQNIIISTDNAVDPPHPPTYTFIEVCAGGGGLSAGLIKAGFTPILSRRTRSSRLAM